MQHRRPKALLIVDVSNLYYCVRKRYGEQCRLDYSRFLARIMEKVDVTRSIAYGSELNNSASGFKSILQRLGFETKYKEPKIFANPEKPGRQTRKADWDVGMAMDVVRFVQDYDVVIFGTADGDLAPCVQYVRENFPDKKCWVTACQISKELKGLAHDWQEISEFDVVA